MAEKNFGRFGNFYLHSAGIGAIVCRVENFGLTHGTYGNRGQQHKGLNMAATTKRDGWMLVECWVGVSADEEVNVCSEEDDATLFDGFSTACRKVCVKLWVELPKTVDLAGEAALVGQGAELAVVS